MAGRVAEVAGQQHRGVIQQVAAFFFEPGQAAQEVSVGADDLFFDQGELRQLVGISAVV